MQSFRSLLTNREIEQVVDFVIDEFVRNKATNTRYHTPENGWLNHEQYRDAFPFALGEIPLDRKWEDLSPREQNGKRLYMNSCVSCHDHGKVGAPGAPWQARPLSYPRAGYSHLEGKIDAVSGASNYAQHEALPAVEKHDERLRRGEKLFQNNCAFCHGRDGTGKNWIGSYLEPHPRNLTDEQYFEAYSREKLKRVVADGVEGSAMPAWRTVLSENEIESIVDYLLEAFLMR